MNDPPPKQPWIQSKRFTLYECNKTVLKSGDWLTDEIIDAGQKILAMQFNKRFRKAGFQSVVLGETYLFEVQSEECVQVLHDGYSHWLTISTVGAPPANILVYDSMYASAGQETKLQAACLMMVSEPNLTLNFLDVQMQSGGSDCGVFALEFATAICYGHAPGKILFDQQRREHTLLGVWRSSVLPCSL